jgi:hypothetical protein
MSSFEKIFFQCRIFLQIKIPTQFISAPEHKWFSKLGCPGKKSKGSIKYWNLNLFSNNMLLGVQINCH